MQMSTTKTRTARASELPRRQSLRNYLQTAPIAALRKRMIAAFDDLRPHDQRLVASHLIAFAGIVCGAGLKGGGRR